MIKDNISNIIKELPSGVKLVAVSKFHPSSAIVEAYEAGQRVFGESRPQEFFSKASQLQLPGIEWHFIGHLQTNKLNKVLPYVSVVESVDSLHLLQAIDRWGAERQRVIDVLLEVHIAKEESKSGFSPQEVEDIVKERFLFPNVRICGLMGMASNTPDQQIIRSDFATISGLFGRIAKENPEMSEFRELSIGMSSDWRIALDFGASVVRIGTAIFGSRL